MTGIETQYFGLSRNLLLIFGLWPFQKSKFLQLQRVLLVLILTSFIMFQLTSFLTTEPTIDVVVKILSSACIFLGIIIKYLVFLINSKGIQYSLIQLLRTCDGLKDENEIAIIERYGFNGKFIATRLTVLGICSIIIFNCHTLLPHIAFVSRLLNYSQPRRMVLFTMEYFIDQEKYFYLILLHVNMTLSIGAMIAIATGSTIITYMKYMCGIFSVASYRIDQAIRSNGDENNTAEDIVIYKKLISAVDFHRKAMMLTTNMISNFEIMFFLLVMIGVLSLSMNLYRVSFPSCTNYIYGKMFQIISFGEAIEEALYYFICIFAIILYMLLSNQVGQEIFDHNNHIFASSYNVLWYETSLKVQKMILFLLQRGNKAFYMSIGGLFQACLETAATLVSASISYFTVLYSTQ